MKREKKRRRRDDEARTQKDTINGVFFVFFVSFVGFVVCSASFVVGVWGDWLAICHFYLLSYHYEWGSMSTRCPLVYSPGAWKTSVRISISKSREKGQTPNIPEMSKYQKCPKYRKANTKKTQHYRESIFRRRCMPLTYRHTQGLRWLLRGSLNIWFFFSCF